MKPLSMRQYVQADGSKLERMFSESRRDGLYREELLAIIGFGAMHHMFCGLCLVDLLAGYSMVQLACSSDP